MMRRRECDNAVALLEKAVTLAGEDSRRGGEFKLWAAQALQEAGRNKQAVEVLKSLKGHRDLDVRKVCVRLVSLLAVIRGWYMTGITPNVNIFSEERKKITHARSDTNVLSFYTPVAVFTRLAGRRRAAVHRPSP